MISQSEAPSPVNPAVFADQKSDQFSATKTLYDASVMSIFWKNFVAGFARALGGMIIWLVLILFSGFLFANYVWPQIHPFLTSYQQLFESFSALPSSSTGAVTNPNNAVKTILDQSEVRNLLDRLEQPPIE